MGQYERRFNGFSITIASHIDVSILIDTPKVKTTPRLLHTVAAACSAGSKCVYRRGKLLLLVHIYSPFTDLDTAYDSPYGHTVCFARVKVCLMVGGERKYGHYPTFREWATHIIRHWMANIESGPPKKTDNGWRASKPATEITSRPTHSSAVRESALSLAFDPRASESRV